MTKAWVSRDEPLINTVGSVEDDTKSDASASVHTEDAVLTTKKMTATADADGDKGMTAADHRVTAAAGNPSDSGHVMTDADGVDVPSTGDQIVCGTDFVNVNKKTKKANEGDDEEEVETSDGHDSSEGDVDDANQHSADHSKTDADGEQKQARAKTEVVGAEDGSQGDAKDAKQPNDDNPMTDAESEQKQARVTDEEKNGQPLISVVGSAEDDTKGDASVHGTRTGDQDEEDQDGTDETKTGDKTGRDEHEGSETKTGDETDEDSSETDHEKENQKCDNVEDTDDKQHQQVKKMGESEIKISLIIPMY